MTAFPYPSAPALRLGFWSGALTTVLTVAFFISLGASIENLMYASSMMLAPAFVALMVSIHHAAPAEKKVWSHLGLSFAIIYAVMCSLTYYVQLTFVQNNYLPITTEAALPFVFMPGTPYFAQDMLGYVFMSLATLAAAPVFVGGRLERWIRRLFIMNAILFIAPTVTIPAIPLPVNEAGTGVGNLVGLYANIVWSAYFASAMLLATVFFRRLAHSRLIGDTVTGKNSPISSRLLPIRGIDET